MPTYLDSKQFIERFVALRKHKKITVAKLAEMVNIPRSTLTNIEVGRRSSISLDEAIAISDALGIDFGIMVRPEPIAVKTV